MSDDKKDSAKKPAKPSTESASTPELKKSDPAKPDSLKPDQSKPGQSKPAPPKADSTQSISTKPGSTKPDSTKPVAGKASSAKDEIRQPESTSGETSQPASTDNTSQQSQPKPTKPLFNAPPMPRMQTSKSAKKGRALPILAMIMALIALLAVAWVVYIQYLEQQRGLQQQVELTQQLKQQTQLIEQSQQSSLSSVQNSLSNQQLINQQSQLIEQLRQSLSATQARVRELSGRQQQDWLLAEAEYLIKLADIRINLDKDKNTAIALLKTADQRIMLTADNSLLELRQVIAADITKLQLAMVPDISGIASQLHAISGQIGQLQLIALEFEPLKKAAASDTLETKEFSWSDIYVDFIDDFVTIKDHSEPVKPLMTVEQRGNLNANIQLALQQAQIALVRGEQGLYLMNLDNAINWISEFFKHNPTSATILEKLAELRETSIEVQLPKDLGASKAIQTINKQRLYQWLEMPQQQLHTNPGESATNETSENDSAENPQ